jgi:predicted ATPase
MKGTMLQKVKVRNFKAIRDSGRLVLTPLTVLIGNNGSGKSSLIEALETLRAFVVHDLNAAMQMWRGIEHVRNKSTPRQTRFSKEGVERSSKPIEFSISGRLGKDRFTGTSVINERGKENVLFVENESVRLGVLKAARQEGRIQVGCDLTGASISTLVGERSLLSLHLGNYIQSWQFLSLAPQAMGEPVPKTRTRGTIQLAKDGRNIAEYLMDIRERDLTAFEGIVDALKYVLPFASDIQPSLTQEIERTVYLQLSERNFKVPGWLLSTGTLRILALLAVLRHPTPPPLIVIEEIENGLDPRSIHLIVDEIRSTVESGRSQVILATHSPYLLDLLPLSSLVLVERVDGQPVFTRPGNEGDVAEWAKAFAPGQLYTMNRLTKGKAS